jgi:hypothetical protein
MSFSTICWIGGKGQAMGSNLLLAPCHQMEEFSKLLIYFIGYLFKERNVPTNQIQPLSL